MSRQREPVFGGRMDCLPLFIGALLLLPSVCTWLGFPVQPVGEYAPLVWIAVGVVVVGVIWFVAEGMRRQD